MHLRHGCHSVRRSNDGTYIHTHDGADRPLFDFVGRRSPAGYLLALDPALGPLFTLLPYGAGGIDSGGLIGIDWNPGEGAFRLVAERLGYADLLW